MAQAQSVVVDLGEFRRRRAAARQDQSRMTTQSDMPVVMWCPVPVWVMVPYWPVL